MALALYIEDQLVDLGNADKEIAIDYAIARIGEIQSRSGVRSAEFELPKTANNRRILQNPDDANSLSTIPYRRLKARLLADGVDVGILTAAVKSTTNTYNVNLYGLNVDFFSTIKERYGKDLDYNAYNHYRTTDIAVTSRTNTQGYLYPVIDNNNESPNIHIGLGPDASDNEIDAEHLWPALFYNEAVEKIVSEAGYTLSIAQPLPYTPILPFSNPDGGGLMRNTDASRYNVHMARTTHTTATAGINNYVEFETLVSNGSAQYWPTAVSSFYTPLFADEITCTVEIGLTYAGTNLIGSHAYNVLLHTGPDNSGEHIFLGQIVGSFTTTNTRTYTVQQSFKLNTDDGFIRCAGAYVVLIADTPFEDDLQIQAGSYIKITNPVMDKPGIVRYLPKCGTGDQGMAFVTPNSILSKNTKQVDLLADYCRLFGYFIEVNERDKVVSLFKFKQVAESKNSCVDWSDKLDVTEPHEILYALDNAAQQNLTTYATDSTVEPETGSNAAIACANGNLPPENDLISVQLAATQSAIRLNGKRLNNIRMMGGPIATNYPLWENQCVQRVLLLQYEDFALRYFYYFLTPPTLTIDTPATQIPLTRFIHPAQQHNLGWGNSLLKDHYEYLTDVFERTRVYRVKVRLTPADINRLDFKKPVYVDYFQSYFYLSQVEEYTPGNNNSTLVELVKLY